MNSKSALSQLFGIGCFHFTTSTHIIYILYHRLESKLTWELHFTSSMYFRYFNFNHIEELTYPQYFSQHVPLLWQGHSFPHIDRHPHGVYCLQDWFFPSAILFQIDGWPADFQEYLSFRVLPLLRNNRDLVGISCSWNNNNESINV